MALRKSDIYSSLWASANQLRGGMDASQYKDYVLTLLFVKYVSDKAKADRGSLIEVPEGGSFDHLVALKGKPDIGEKINLAVRRLAEANDLQGVINNADFDDPNKLGDGKARQDRLSNLIGIFQDLDFSRSKAEGDDLLGDAYEYLMRHFATESGKSKGQFYTPAEVSRVMAQLLQIPTNARRSTTVYDPTCGSGSLLIKVAAAAPNGLTIYGQENDVATWALSRMNMILHGNETHDIRRGDSLADPKFRAGDKLDTFDYLVANPPFSVKTWKNGFENDYGRFDGFAEPPENGDYAFLLHMVKSLKPTGRGAVILPHGVLFRGNSEGVIRKELVKRGLIKAVVGLPRNLFYGTGIPACVIVIDKKEAADRDSVFMIDASKGFEKDGPKNRLRPRDMHRIVDAYVRQADIPRYSRAVPVAEIADPSNDFNLNISRYIDASDPEDIQDLYGHLKGGIPNRDFDALSPYWEAFPSLRTALVKPLRDGYAELAVGPGEVRSTITDFPEYLAFCDEILDEIAQWWTEHRNKLLGITKTTRPVVLIDAISEDLLERFLKRPLIDEYGVYEQLMQYWNAMMHDDVTLIVGEGWLEAAQPREARIVGQDNKGKLKYETAHLTFGTRSNTKRWVMDLVPPDLIVNRYFKDEKDELERLYVAVEFASESLQDFLEEHAIEEGLLWDATDDDDKLNSKLATTQLKRLKQGNGSPDEIDALKEVIRLFAAEAAAKKVAKGAQEVLDRKVFDQYRKLVVEDVQGLVLDDKWLGAITVRVSSEIQTLIAMLVARTETLAQRYEHTVAELESQVATAAAAVDHHLRSMGVCR
jgi:type I restriction enzyme M protein